MVKLTVRDISAVIVGLIFLSIGIDHFVRPEWYNPIVPKILGDPEFWVYLSGVTEIFFGITIIPRKTREYSAVFGILMLIALYWANINMWINNIALDGVKYDTEFHIGRLFAQVGLILLITYIGEITPFKNEQKGVDGMDIFKGRITSCAFESGDRIVIGDWHDSPLGKFTDIMWADSKGNRTLIAPNKQVADYVNSMYAFENTIIENISIHSKERSLSLVTETMNLQLSWNRGWRIPFKRSLFFIATVELFFAKLLFGTKTHGTTNNNRKEWYAIDRVSKVTSAQGIIDGRGLGTMTEMTPCKFGFSEAPKKPSSCEVRTHIL